MSIKIKCPGCEKRIRAKDHLAGKRVRCPDCSGPIQVPELVPTQSSDDAFDETFERPAETRRRRRSSRHDHECWEKPRSRRVPDVADERRSRRSRIRSADDSNTAAWAAVGSLAACAIMIAAGFATASAMEHFNWHRFKHPTGLAQVDMPGVPTLDQSASVDGEQVFRLITQTSQMSLVARKIAGTSQALFKISPNKVEEAINAVEEALVAAAPGTNRVSSQRITNGSCPGSEIELDTMGKRSWARFYIAPGAIILAEFIDRGNASHSQRERFFNSVRGPNGEVIIGGAPPPDEISPTHRPESPLPRNLFADQNGNEFTRPQTPDPVHVHPNASPFSDDLRESMRPRIPRSQMSMPSQTDMDKLLDRIKPPPQPGRRMPMPAVPQGFSPPAFGRARPPGPAASNPRPQSTNQPGF